MNNKISFIEALKIIFENENVFMLCDFKNELTGIYPSICVYKGDACDFIGKLRWPKDGKPSSVDEDLQRELLKYKKWNIDINVKSVEGYMKVLK